jgi:hypothetical protein
VNAEDRVTAAAVARRAGVGRAAVSNWRRRYPDFPRPVGGGSNSPLFAWSEVEAWLIATGKAGQLATQGHTDTGTQRVDAAPEAAVTLVAQETALADLTARRLLARAMAALLPSLETAYAEDNGEPSVVLDPACGDGGLLLAVADRFGDRAMLIGQEPDDVALEWSAVELRTHPSAPPYDVVRGHGLLDDRLGRYRGNASAVVCTPPTSTRAPTAPLADDPRWRFGTPEPADVELAWVQLCVSYLRPRGVAVVLVSTVTATRPSGRPIRAALVRSGVLCDVIALPAGISSAGASMLWVLRRPDAASVRAPVRMLDLSGLVDPAELPDGQHAWEDLLDSKDESLARAIRRVDLLDGETELLPARHVRPARAAMADDLIGLTRRLRTLYARVGEALPLPARAAGRRPPTTVTIAELDRAGALTVRPRDTTPRAGDVLLRTLGRPPVVAAGTAVDEVGVAQVVEIDPERLDAHFVALFLRADAGATPVANTHGALSRDDLRRCRIPRMSLTEQRRYGAAFRHLTDLQDALAALATAGGHLFEQTIYGLTTGALLPHPSPGRGSIAGDPTESETQ